MQILTKQNIKKYKAIYNQKYFKYIIEIFIINKISYFKSFVKSSVKIFLIFLFVWLNIFILFAMLIIKFLNILIVTKYLVYIFCFIIQKLDKLRNKRKRYSLYKNLNNY